MQHGNGPVEITGEESEIVPKHSAWLGADWSRDANQTLTLLAGERVNWLVVDHYALDARWEAMLRPVCDHLMVIDDLADRLHDCDLLLDQNLGHSSTDYAALLPPACQTLIGPQFALLRPEFAKLRSYSLARRETAGLKRILVTMGGIDIDNVTGSVLDALRTCPLPNDCQITVVMGPHAPWVEDVCQRSKKMPWPTEVMVNVRDMAVLMAESDLAVGAAGGTAWERCCLGLPTLIIILASNQLVGARALNAENAVWVVSNDTAMPGGIREAIQELSKPQKLMGLSMAARRITDGTGTVRVARVLWNVFH